MSSIFKADLPNRADLSQFLIHLTKDGTYDFYDAKVGPPPGFERVFRPVRARDSLKDMLTSKKIEVRSPFGYFRLKINMYRSRFGRVFQNADANPDWMKAVCFSETPLRELKYFYQAVSKKRIRPEYLKALDDSLLNNGVSFIPLMPFIETFGPLVISGASGYSDFRWEREWRKQGELNFEFEDVAFGICPANEIPAFEALVGGSFIFIDPDWDEQTLKAVLSAKAKHLLQQF
jgi:hypothetical protein